MNNIYNIYSIYIIYIIYNILYIHGNITKNMECRFLSLGINHRTIAGGSSKPWMLQPLRYLICNVIAM